MPFLTNKSSRVIHVDGSHIVPGATVEVSEAAMEHRGVALFLEAGELKEEDNQPPKKAASSEGRAAEPVKPAPKA